MQTLIFSKLFLTVAPKNDSLYPVMNDNVVYRSQYERDADIFWSQHPEYVAGFLIALCLFVIVVFGVALRKIFKK